MSESNSELDMLVARADCAQEAFALLRDYAKEQKGTVAFAYFIGPSLLRKQFNEPDMMISMYSFAQEDVKSSDKRLANRANTHLNRYHRWQNDPKFIASLLEHGIAAYTTGNVLYVAHKCVKPDSGMYQVSHFVKGQGPSGDTDHISPEQILENSQRGADIPQSAKFVPYGELDALESAFLVA